MTSQLTIGLILPDVLSTYGDDGNALVLRQRARMRGISAEILPLPLGTEIPEDLDIYTMGGGEDTAQILGAEHLNKSQGLHRAAAKGRPILAICAGLQVLGVSFHAAGRVVDGLGLLDATTSQLAKRTIGELAGTPLIEGLHQPLTGFENHMGATILGSDAQPLQKVSRGIGNCDAHAHPEQVGVDGAVQGSIIATYMHGPALARNPELADLLLERATGQTLEALDLPEIEQLRKERLG
ncbi:MAG: glutamine amidotransferase [Corynebacterium sp.]|nr:glutamine amidotransferase [Corynebacterium sp.]